MPAAVDLFAGAGGATQGMRDAGLDVVVAVETDAQAAATWRANHPGTMLEKDIADTRPAEIMDHANLVAGELTVLKSCPPCQGFSSLRGSSRVDERRNDLVLDTLRFVDALLPRALIMENVPGLARDARFERLLGDLHELHYSVLHGVVQASDIGVPQRRRRLVLVAVHKNAGTLPTHLADLIRPFMPKSPTTAGDALQRLHREMPSDDPHHRWRASSDTVRRRIQAVPLRGNRFDLPGDLRLACHQKLRTVEGKELRAATGSYGRVRSDEPAPTMTTRCTTPACGSFIHPTEDRGLSLREAAAFQTFPTSYVWTGGYDSIERQIGNALPVGMAEALTRAVLQTLQAPR